MNLNEKFGVSEGKLRELLSRIKRLAVDVGGIEERFSRGGGKGGQKRNKTSNRVQLFHPGSGIRVSCQRERERSVNRFIALRELVDRLEERLQPGSTRRSREIEKTRRRKSRRRAKARSKHHPPNPPS